MKLIEKKCIPCEDELIKPFDLDLITIYMQETPDWKLEEEGVLKISRNFLFADFKQAIVFVNGVAKIAENEGHHPDIYVWYNRVKCIIYTHAIKGLCENDFIVATKIDAFFDEKDL